MPYYKSCFIPQCKNNTYNTPNKVFICVPKPVKERKAWFEAAGRNINDVAVSSHFDCCEDHFNLPKDMENYLEFKMMGRRKKMKKGIVPHVFNFPSNNKCKKRSKLHIVNKHKQQDVNMVNMHSKKKVQIKIISNEKCTIVNLKNSAEKQIKQNNNSKLAAKNEETNSIALQMTEIFIKSNPEMYLGVNKCWYNCGFITVLSDETKLSENNIKLTLMKIKKNYSFKRLGDMFGVSETIANRIFNESIPGLSMFLKQLIDYPEKESIRKLLPIPFRHKYQTNIQSIIYCLEIEIDEPVHHLMTWSEYKKCHSLKYIISSTPDGFINFVSKGYGGQITDLQLIEKCQNILPLLKNNNYDLIKSPSVSVNTESLPVLRIHIERVVRRLKEYELLRSHSVICTNLIPFIDNIIIVAAALINIQRSI